MSYWNHIKGDYDKLVGCQPSDDIVKCISIDAFVTDDPNEEGSVIANVIRTKFGELGVVYNDPRAEKDDYAQRVIATVIESLKLLGDECQNFEGPIFTMLPPIEVDGIVALLDKNSLTEEAARTAFNNLMSNSVGVAVQLFEKMLPSILTEANELYADNIPHMLISVSERNIETFNHQSYRAAYAQMEKELYDTMGGVGNLDKYKEDDDYALDKYSAWSNAYRDANADWLIIKL